MALVPIKTKLINKKELSVRVFDLFNKPSMNFTDQIINESSDEDYVHLYILRK